MFSNTSEIIQNLAIQEVTPISEDAFYLEYSNAGTAESYCLHFTFRTIAKAEAFFEMTSMYGFPIERVGNQVIMLPSPDSLTPGIWLCNKEEIAFITKNIDAADWIKFINENHANGDLVKYNGQRSENDDKIVSFYRCGGHCSININLFQSKFSLVERITKTEQFMGHSVFFILFVVNHLSELNSMPKELVPFIMMRLLTEKIDENVVVLNQTFPFPLQLVDKYKKTDYFLECNQHTNILHLLCSNDTEANLLFNQLNRNVPNLFLKRYHNEILMD